METIGQAYLDTVIRRFKAYKDLGDKTLMQLSEADLFYQPSAESNSMAVMIQHLSGNMLSRWTNFLDTDGEKPWRDRDEEFAAKSYTRAILLDKWEAGWECLLQTLSTLTAEDLLKTIYIRKEPLLAIDAINRQLAHYSSHVGQMMYLGRMIRGKEWQSLSIPPGGSAAYNASSGIKDPAKKF